MWHIVIPILNSKISFPKKPLPFILDEIIFVNTLSNEYYGALERYLKKDYSGVIQSNSKCISIKLEYEPESWDVLVLEYIRKIRTTLNFFSESHPLLISFAVVFRQSKQLKAVKIIDVELWSESHRFRYGNFKCKSTITHEAISSMYNIVNRVCNKEKTTYITLDRFNSSLTRSSWHDQLIDTTISLESLISSTSELRFKFALFLSFIVEKDPNLRLEAFELFKNLYDARSALVHGSESKSINKVKHNWPKIHAYLIISLTYYFIYLDTNSLKSWENHLQNLVLGIDERITD